MKVWLWQKAIKEYASEMIINQWSNIIINNNIIYIINNWSTFYVSKIFYKLLAYKSYYTDLDAEIIYEYPNVKTARFLEDIVEIFSA